MKIIINERQLRTIIESEKQSKFKKSLEDSIQFHGGDVNSASESSGIELYKFIEMGVVEHYEGDLDLKLTPIKSLGNLKYVGGYLDLSGTKIKSLGDLEEVGGNFSFGGSLRLYNCKELSSFGELKKIGGLLNLIGCPLSELSDEKIRSQVEIKGKIYR
jgi:hypothetical protein